MDESQPESLRDILKRKETGGVKKPSAEGSTSPTTASQSNQHELCHGSGWLREKLPVGHPLFGQMFACSCVLEERERNRFQRLLRLSELPVGLRTCTFESFERSDVLEEAWRAALDFAQGVAPYKWLFLHGSSGWGKTHLAAAIINARIEHREWGPPGVFARGPDLLRRLREGFRDETYGARLEAFSNCPLLVLDDLGAEYRRRDDEAMSWASEQLYMILDTRQVNLLQTVVTSNETVDSLGARIADRLLATRRGIVRAVYREIPSDRSGQRW